MTNAINWFEIPVTDFTRAKRFYETLFDAEVMEMPFPGGKYGMLPADMQNGVGGGIVQGEGFTPSDKGTIVYLNGGDDLNIPLSRIENAGGKILMPKTSIGENGFMAHFIDTEVDYILSNNLYGLFAKYWQTDYDNDFQPIKCCRKRYPENFLKSWIPHYTKRFFKDIPHQNKVLRWTEGTQFDFYDQPKQVSEAMEAIRGFIKNNMN